MCAKIANLGCEMEMIGIASAQDVDRAIALGLNYPHGLLALADWLGVKDVTRSWCRCKPSPATTATVRASGSGGG